VFELSRSTGAQRAAVRPMGLLGLFASLSVVLGGALLSGCSRSKPEESSPAGTLTATPAAVHAAIEVGVTAVVKHDISDTANVTGALGALNDVVVGIKNPGRLVGVFAREGDHVHAGQIVAQQDTADIESQINQARGNLRSTQTRLDQALTAYSSAVTNLKLTDETTQSAIDQAEASLKSSQDSLILIRRGARAQELEQSVRSIEAAQADLDSAMADQTQSISDLKRYDSLYALRAISAQQLDQARTVKASADARVRAGMARLESAKQAYSLMKEGAQPEDVHRSKSIVDQAQQALNTATSNRAMVELRKADVASAKSNIDTSRAGVEVARAQLTIAQQALKDSAIRSPIDGVVAERKVEPGMQLAITKADVMRIVALNSLYFDGQLPQSLENDVRVGMPVTVTVDSLPGKDIKATITRIFPVASIAARSVTVRVSLQNQNGPLRPQMFARGRITLGTHKSATIVQREAVIEVKDDGTKTGVVFVVQDGKAIRKPVVLGYTNVVEDEILSGVSAGETVITTGQAQVQDGDPITVAKKTGNDNAIP